jgi:hypothetical protein
MTTGLFTNRGHNQGRSFAVHRAEIRKRNRACDRDKLDAFAEGLAETGTITGAAKRLGITQQRGSVLFKRICAELGWQAQ